MPNEVEAKILVVDDEKDTEVLLRQRLRHEIHSKQYSFSFVPDGEQALEHLQQHDDVDIILTDLNMPVMDGMTLLEKIPDVSPNARTIMVSAYGNMDNFRVAMNHGAYDFLSKPIDFQDLKDTPGRALESLQEARESERMRSKLDVIERELNMAQILQKHILPTSFPTTDEYDVHANMVAAHSIGGDFYDLFELDRGKIGILIADVSDKGVPAAMFMMASRTLLKACAACSVSPSQVLGQVNFMLSQDNEAMTFVTLFYGIYDPETLEFKYTNAGHNPPILVLPDQEPKLLAPTGDVALGIDESLQFSEKTVTLEPGNAVVLYTDGVSEAERKGGDMFGMERFIKLAHESSFESAEQMTDIVFEQVATFVEGNEQSDDITCLVLFIPPTGSDSAVKSNSESESDSADNSRTVTFPNRLEEIRTVQNALEEFTEQNELPTDVAYHLQFALEEIVTNVISYAYKDDEEHEIKVIFTKDENSISIEVIDDGYPFDPLEEAPGMDSESSLEDRPIGGAGVALTKQMMTELKYKREGDCNHLLMIKKF